MSIILNRLLNPLLIRVLDGLKEESSTQRRSSLQLEPSTSRLPCRGVLCDYTPFRLIGLGMSPIWGISPSSHTLVAQYRVPSS